MRRRGAGDVFENWQGPLHHANGEVVQCKVTGLEADMQLARRRLFDLIDRDDAALRDAVREMRRRENDLLRERRGMCWPPPTESEADRE